MQLRVALFFEGGLLLSKGTVISDRHLDRLKSWNIAEVETETAHASFAEIVSMEGGVANKVDLAALGLLTKASSLPAGFETDNGATYVIEEDLAPSNDSLVIQKNVLLKKGLKDGANIEATGWIKIAGDIGAGVRIVAVGDVTVSGDIRGTDAAPAVIEAGRIQTSSVWFGRLISKQDVVSVALNSCVVRAGREIVLSDSGPGIAAGELEAGSGIKTPVVQSAGGKPAVLRVTLTRQKQQFLSITRLEKALEEKNDELSKLHKAIEIVRLLGEKVVSLPPEKKQELALQSKRYMTLKNECSDIGAAIERLRGESEQEVSRFDQCPVQIMKIKPSVDIIIGSATLKVSNFQDTTGYYMRNGRLMALGLEKR